MRRLEGEMKKFNRFWCDKCEEFMEAKIEHIGEIIQVVCCKKCGKPVRLKPTLDAKAKQLLRELFYCRVGIGDKVSDLVHESAPMLWKRIYTFLEKL